MVKKLVWFMVSCMMALSLVMTSCGGAEEEEEAVEEEEVVEEEEEEEAVEEEEVVEEEEEEEVVGADKPQYGGVHYDIQTRGDPGGFDPRVVMIHFTRTLPLTHDMLLSGDWAKGPAGTGETDWQFGFMGRTDLFAGQLAESWELVDNETLIYNIRQGVHFLDKEPVNGREVTAEDVAWNCEIEWATPGSNLQVFFKEADHLISATALDRYTVELKFPAAAMAIHVMEDSCRIPILPPDTTEMYGDQNEWELSNGTGPFMLTDLSLAVL